MAVLWAAERVGFVREGLLRRSSRVAVDFADEVLLSLLAAEYDAG